MNTMNYKGYLAHIEYSHEDACFIGRIAGINDVVGFHGDSVSELQAAFKEAVDDYLKTCKKVGRAAQKSYSGKIMLRIPPELHARAGILAQAHGKSLNSLVADLLSRAS